MPKTVIFTDQAPSSPTYSQAIRAAGLVFVSGQGPFDPTSGDIVGDTIQAQTAQCLRNISAILAAANSSLDEIVTATFILADPGDFAGMNEEWTRWFSSEPPARQGAKLPIDRKGMRVSIAAVALARD